MKHGKTIAALSLFAISAYFIYRWTPGNMIVAVFLLQFAHNIEKH